MTLHTIPWSILLDPADPPTLFPPRTQLIVAGNTIQRGTTTAVERTGHGYGLDLDNNNEVHSFPTLDGETLRLGVRRRHGRPMLVHRHQFIGNDAGHRYRYQPGKINTTTGPNTDRLFYDGTRTRWNMAVDGPSDPLAWANSFGTGTGATVRWGTVFEVPDWSQADDLQAFIAGMHSPRGGPASPFTNFVGQGRWNIVHRNQRTPLTAGDPAPKGPTVGGADIGQSDVGKLWAVVIEAQFDPLTGRFRAWLNKGQGWSTVADVGGGWGWGYHPDDPDSRIWHGVLNGFYSWHNAPSVVAPYNWDAAYPTREVVYGPSGLLIGDGATAADIGRALETYLATTTVDPDQPGTDGDLRDRVDNLTGRVGTLETRWARLGDLVDS